MQEYKMKTQDYYFPSDKEGMLEELTFKFIRMGFDNFAVTKLGAGSMLTIYLNKEA